MKNNTLGPVTTVTGSNERLLPKTTANDAQPEVVMTDECGDSLWDAVLAQGSPASLPGKNDEQAASAT